MRNSGRKRSDGEVLFGRQASVGKGEVVNDIVLDEKGNSVGNIHARINFDFDEKCYKL
jgi:hypothetical protein